MTRVLARTAVFVLGLLAVSSVASAQVVQSIQIAAGGFFPNGYDTRPNNDVLIKDLQNTNPMLFLVSDFRGATISGEWNLGLGNHVEIGLGTGFYHRSVPSTYADVTFRGGTEISQLLTLRVIPVTALVRFLPIGKPSSFQPYLAAGVSGLSFRYSEVGDFVDDFDQSIFTARFIKSGMAAGPILAGGFRAPLGGDIYAFTMEIRHQWGTGDLGANNGFLTNKIDLGGTHLNFGVLVRF